MARMRLGTAALVPALGLLAALQACGPMSPEAAARVCEDRARRAQSPVSGTIGIGMNQDGPVASTDLSVGISSDFIRGRDPLLVYEECVRDRSGQGPIRPPRLTP